MLRRAHRLLSPFMILVLGAPATVTAQTPEGTLTASDGAFSDLFGDAIAIDGDTILVGARGRSGSLGGAYVFRRVAGTWSEEAILVPAGAVAQDQVGSGVGVSADGAVLGAPDPLDILGPASGPGSAHVFRRSGSSWAQEATLIAADGQSYDQLGHAAAISGDAIVAGAPGDETSGAGSRLSGRGAAYVFRNSAGAWSQETKLVAGDGAAGDRFGHAAAIDGDVIVVGAPLDDDGGLDSGSVYVFRRTAGTWSVEAKLVANDAAAGDQFGHAVGVDGDVAIVGAYLADGTGADVGAAYVFRRTAGVWAQEAKLVAADASANDRAGFSVAIAGDEALVGSTGAGGAYLHIRTGGAWAQSAKLTNGSASLLGYSVAMTDDFVTAGAPLTTVSGTTFVGAADVWCTNAGPVLLDLAPSGGLFHQNTLVTLSGSSFSQVKAKTVTFGGVAATNVTWVANDTVTCLAPTGTQGQTVDVVITQEGQSSTLVGAFTYEGTEVLTISPSTGPAVGGPPVTITGNHFVDDGSTVVTFGGLAASIQSITPPSTMMVAVPAGTRGSTVDVTVTSTNGTDAVINGFTYDTLGVLSVDLAGGNLTGGTVLNVTVDYPTNLADTTATLDGSPVAVISVTGATVSIQTPGVVAPDGVALDVGVTNSNGTGTLAGAFTYTPALYVDVVGTVAAGGTLTIDWLTDPTVAGPQFVTIWVGHPLIPPITAPIFGYAGLIERVPLIFIFNALPSTLNPLALPFGPLPPAVAGFPLELQLLASGEGDTLGSFSNPAGFVIP